MNKRISTALVSLLLAGCGQGTGSTDVSLDAEDLEDFVEWKYDQEEVENQLFITSLLA